MYNLGTILYVFLLLSTAISNKNSATYEKSTLFNELNRQLRNAVCCVNKMKCCNSSFGAEHIAIRSVLIRCPDVTGDPTSTISRKINKPISYYREDTLKRFQGFDEDEFLSQSVIRHCRKKLLLTIKLTSKSNESFSNQYIVVDHVYDTITKKSVKLITPYVVKLIQEPILQMYELKFLHVVNSLAKEEIYNKHIANFTGCDTKSQTPTCGKITYKDKVIPYSEGFCCSCDAVVNTKRQPQSINPYSESNISYSDPAFLLDGIECPRNLRGHETITQAKDLFDKTDREMSNKVQNIFCPKSTKGSTSKPYINWTVENKITSFPKTTGKQAELYFDSLSHFIKDKNELNALENLHNRSRSKRQVLPSGAQRRGGQNCADRFTPKGLNPETYHESAHCLRFSDLWYTVYHLQKPAVEHSVLVQIFEKFEDITGNVRWRDLTNGKMIRVGTIQQHFVDNKKTISIKYDAMPQKSDDSSFCLNYKTALLLIPEGNTQCKVKKYPELRAGPSEYLIVHPNQITMDGDQCNVAGVGFEGFVKQRNRCSRPRDSCLSNQPHHLWKHDHEAEKLGKRGCFFLKHFGKLPNNPIRRHPSTSQQFLTFEYSGSFNSLIDIEIRADFNTVLRPLSTARITEVYVDSTSASETILTVKITNAGLTSSSFIARLTDCPLEMPASFGNIESKSALIPPQHQHVFNLKIKCPLPADRFHCSVEALNSKRELVALRRIRMQKFDRCICTWHCLCACVGSSEGLKCIPMSLQHYHAAGFQGALPISTIIVHYTLLDEALSLISYIFLFLIMLLLLLGLCKSLIGLFCSVAIGQWGLNLILNLPKPINHYYEHDLKGRKVRYDGNGWPIHPVTKKRVRSIPCTTEFCLNIIFFFLYPSRVFLTILKVLLCPTFTYNKYTSEQSKTGTYNTSDKFSENQNFCFGKAKKTCTPNINDSNNQRLNEIENNTRKDANLVYPDEVTVLCTNRQLPGQNILKAIREVSEYTTTNNTDHTHSSSSASRSGDDHSDDSDESVFLK